MKLLIVIVNYRSAELTLECLKSIPAGFDSCGRSRNYSQEPEFPASSPAAGSTSETDLGLPDFVHVVVTDNQSPDDSLAKLEIARASRPWLSIQPLPKNGGFAYGNNSAIAQALGIDPPEIDPPDTGFRPVRVAFENQIASTPDPNSTGQRPATPPDFILLLNPDTVARPGAITALLEFMQANPKVGIAGSRLEDPDGTPQRSAFRFHSIAGEFERGIRMGVVTRLLKQYVIAPPVSDQAGPCDWVAGASMMVRREVFESAGLMDELYFMYFEEVDLCLAARRAGWPCWYVPSSRVVHLVGSVSQMSDNRKHRKRRPAYWFDSRRRYFVKNHGWIYAALADAAYLIAHSIWRLRRFLQHKEDTDPPKLLLDSVTHSVFFRGRAV